MWNSFNTGEPLGITAEITTIEGGNGDQIHAYVARPAGDERRGGIVAIHHMPGWDEFYMEFCERLARHGYDVIAPDLYCRFGHGTPDDVTATVRSQGGVHDDSVVADCQAAMTWLKALPTSNGRVGIIGSCSGGRHAVLTASLVPGFDAVVDLWAAGWSWHPTSCRRPARWHRSTTRRSSRPRSSASSATTTSHPRRSRSTCTRRS
ncbi:MAG TPA: dienelactone hydrolase family protein [Acidimicrobiales bacterium]|nr:dienelactone hydrolase family protein [Acidimicrobiales bacterium]